jgi:hypothetical protein
MLECSGDDSAIARCGPNGYHVKRRSTRYMGSKRDSAVLAAAIRLAAIIAWSGCGGPRARVVGPPPEYEMPESLDGAVAAVAGSPDAGRGAR